MMKWTPIDLGENGPRVDSATRSWTESAIDCHESNRDCNNCLLRDTFNYRWDGFGFEKCHMPQAVQSLLNRKIPKPSEQKKGSERFNKIVEILKNSDVPLSSNDLAAIMGLKTKSMSSIMTVLYRRDMVIKVGKRVTGNKTGHTYEYLYKA